MCVWNRAAGSTSVSETQFRAERSGCVGGTKASVSVGVRKVRWTGRCSAGCTFKKRFASMHLMGFSSFYSSFLQLDSRFQQL